MLFATSYSVRYGSYLKGSPDADAKDTQGA